MLPDHINVCPKRNPNEEQKEHSNSQNSQERNNEPVVDDNRNNNEVNAFMIECNICKEKVDA